jgi:predicted enzyme related to lactoylglutathione lyase
LAAPKPDHGTKAAGAKPVAKPKAPPRATATPPATAAPSPPRRVPSGIGLMTHHMDYTSQDVESIKRFYTEALGFSDFVHDPEMNYLMVKTGGSSSLGFMPPMAGPPEEWRPPREPAIYLIVEDVDRAYQGLLAKNVTFDKPPQDMPWRHRVALLRDPEGRRVCLAQILEPST